MKDIKGFEGKYAITEDGRVWSCLSGRFISPRIGDVGYYEIFLWRNNEPKHKRIHRLIAEAFISNPENKREVNHKNGVKTDNRIENLEWCTPQENITHAFETGLNNNRGENNKQHKLKTNQIIQIRKDFNKITQTALSIKYGVSLMAINKIVHKKTWRHI